MKRRRCRRSARHDAPHVLEPARQLLVDFWGCPDEHLRDLAAVRGRMREAAERAGATIVEETFHHFTGGGVTGVVAVKESHLAIHTWPETGYAAVDIFLCGTCRPEEALDTLRRHFRPARENIREHSRTPRASDAQAVEAEASSARQPATPSKRRRPGIRALSRAAKAMRGNGSAADAAPRADAGRGTSLAPVCVLAVVLAACSIVYELLLAQTLSALLGNTVLRYSVTIGFYLGALGLGAMLCPTGRIDVKRYLVRVEVGLSLLGGLSVPLFYFLDMAQRHFYYTADTFLLGSALVPILFFGLTHALIVAIGLLSGFEVPLLLAMAEQRRPGSTNRVLGIDYLGALVGSLLFPLLFLRQFGLLATGFSIAALNAAACIGLAATLEQPAPVRRRGVAAGVAVASVLLLALSQAGALQQYFLQKFYYADSHTTLSEVFEPDHELATVDHRRSLYQSIDIVEGTTSGMWAWRMVSRKLGSEPDAPAAVRLYLNRDYQFFSGMEEVYHEWFVHVPPQAVGRAPRRVLVLGGGDNLALRELVRYESIEKIVHVELDPEMISLAKNHPVLARLNGRPDLDPRVRTVEADAFSWLRRSRERFDAIYVDMPYPRDYAVAQVYSREFYSLVRSHLTDDGFLMLDAPDADCRKEDGGLWSVYQSTLDAAGFRRVVPVLSRFNLEDPRISEIILATSWSLAEQVRGGEIEASFDPSTAPAVLRDAVDQSVNSELQEFVLALPAARPINTEWIDMGLDHHAFGPSHLELAFFRECADVRTPRAVNSIFRPVLPLLRFDYVDSP